MSDCFHPNPLQHGGSSQDMRLVPALNPETAPVDGRTMADFILFMEKYGTLLNYYDTTNSINGHWKSFIAQDLSTILASISKTDYNDCLENFYAYFQQIQDGDGDLTERLKVLFDISFTLLDQIRRWMERLTLNTPIRELMFQEIRTRLAKDLRNLILYYRAAQVEGLVDTTFVFPAVPDSYAPSNTQDILMNIFPQEWWVKTNPPDVINGWEHYKGAYLTPEVASVTIFGDPAWTNIVNIQYGSTFIKNTFTDIYNCFVRIVNDAQKRFDESVSTYPFHSAHNGLLLTFLRLYGVMQKGLNQFTDRHLNFYYSDVLRIERKPENPDSAHVVFTLAKNNTSYTINKGTALLAGKDDLGKLLIYKTTDVVTINHSEIAVLKSIFIDDDPAQGGVYAAEVSNSSDGKGKALSKEDPSWFAFGSEQAALADEDKSMSEAEIGFFIASPLLQLSESERLITIELNVQSFGAVTFVANELAGKFDIFLTGKKEWVQVNNITSADTSQPNAIKVDVAAKKIIVKFALDGLTDSIVGFNPEIHQAEYTTVWPVVKLLLKKSIDVALFKKLGSVSINNIQLTATVNNAVSCILHCDQGSIDNKNPFMPFGPRPKNGSAFFFGSAEVFSKKLTSLTLNLGWLGTPVDNSFYDHYLYKKPGTGSKKSGTADGTTNYIGLTNSASTHSFIVSGRVKDGDEKVNNPVPEYLFQSGDNQTIDTTNQLVFSNLFTDSDPDLDAFTSYDPVLRRGFLKISLINPPKAFGHDVFTKVYTEQVIAVNKDAANNTLPNEPYTPLLQPLTYNYTAQETIQVGSDNNETKGQFFHLFPFGFAEQNQAAYADLVPVFIHTDKLGADHALQGALHIAIDNIDPGQLLTLYFEFSEGSEDASLDPAGVRWSYLSNNQWKPLDDLILADSTNSFLGSGIVKIAVPEDMNDNNTIMPGTHRWIRIGVSGAYKAYPKIYSIFTNAAKVTFENNGNDPQHLAKPLAAGKIVKLLDSNGLIKKIEQPYDSFDGRLTEQSKQYYIRVSERLRHKNRAITIWDYEKIILEEFNYLYKVKCLNHTNEETETAPGCVRIIVIPDMSTKSTGNLFEPKISNNKRQLIYKFITHLNCPFADVQVQNPQYEAIRVKCEVKIREGLDVADHIDKLKTDLDKFLAPWAFEEGRGIDFGGTMHRSQIIYFMEKLSYVDYVTDFLMDLYIDGIAVKTNVDEVKATTSKSILTTNRNHQIGTNVCAS